MGLWNISPPNPLATYGGRDPASLGHPRGTQESLALKEEDIWGEALHPVLPGFADLQSHFLNVFNGSDSGGTQH